MTQQDKDREAFERWALNEGSYDLAQDRDGDYVKPDTWELHRGWQAARDHHAPTLTQTEAALVIASLPTYEDGGVFISKILGALCAAGIRFKKEA